MCETLTTSVLKVSLLWLLLFNKNSQCDDIREDVYRHPAYKLKFKSPSLLAHKEGLPGGTRQVSVKNWQCHIPPPELPGENGKLLENDSDELLLQKAKAGLQTMPCIYYVRIISTFAMFCM